MNLEEDIISYISYILSAYSLTLFIIWFIKTCKFSSNEIKSTNIYKWYSKNNKIVVKYSIAFSMIFNLIFGLFELVIGIYYKSWWFITLSLYYLILCFMKLSLIVGTKRFGEDKKIEYKKLKNTGIILLFLNIILTCMIILILTQNKYNTYSGYLIYVVALYDFYLIITAIINVFKYKNSDSPVISASKCISLTVAMISMLSLEVAMIYEFGENDTNFKLIMTSCTGFGITLINTIMASIMIYKGKKEKKINESSNFFIRY